MPESSSFGTRIVLVVDDEPNVTLTLVLVLNRSKQNLFAIGSTSLPEALSIVRGIRPDLVLLDVMMPGAVGLQHAIQMRDKSGCKILLLSGQTTTGDALDAYMATGGEPFEILPKPVHPTHLITKILQMLNQPPLLSDWTNPLNFHIQ